MKSLISMMNWVNAFKIIGQNASAFNTALFSQTSLLNNIIRHKSSSKKPVPNRFPSICRHNTSEDLNCLDPESITIERGRLCDGRLIRSFLYTEHWPREPSVVGLWMSLDSPYLDTLTDTYSYSGDRFLAFERIKRTNERRLVGLCVCRKMMPWMIGEYEEWAYVTASRPERNRMYFLAHCLRRPNFFAKYRVNFIYEIEVLCTAQEVTGHEVGAKLVQTALAHAEELRYPLVQLIAVSQYTAGAAQKCGMKLDWTLNYSELIDYAGQRVFFPRRPHHTVGIYVKYFSPQKSLTLPCLPPY